ncbi:MAG: hydroxyethylthiazole kinase [Gammaproteobacteria bacterium]
MNQKIQELLIKLKVERPLILNITQYYPLDLIVNGLRSVGALPITSNSEQEIEELLKLSKSVVINLGKLDDTFIQLCNQICEAANQLNKPIILDPVGAGASHYRTETSINLIKDHKISVVRGYPSEIAALVNAQLIIIGTESTTNDSAIDNAMILSEKYDMSVVISGKMNTVIDQAVVDHYNFDSTLLLKVAGISSLLSSLIGAFHAVEENRFVAATSTVSYYAHCVGIAKNKAYGPGSFKTELIDELYMNSYTSI